MFLPHVLIYRIGEERYRNILIDHIIYVNSVPTVTIFDVGLDSLKNTLINTWKDDDDKEHSIMQFLMDRHYLIFIKKVLKDGK